MSSLVIWMISLTVGLCVTILAAGALEPQVHIAMSAMICLAFAGLGIGENRSQHAAGLSKSAIAATTAHYMGLIWAWGALAILVTYMFILNWSEWWQFFAGFAFAAVLCLFFASALNRDAEAGREDASMVRISRALVMVQLAGMVVAVVGLIIDKKVTHFMFPSRYPDWAANNIALSGAVALALISANALWTSRGEPSDAGASPERQRGRIRSAS